MNILNKKPIIRKELRKQLFEICNKCYYCTLTITINPLNETQPFHRKFQSYSRPVILNLDGKNTWKLEDGDNCVLVHSWCHSLIKNVPTDERETIIEQLRVKVEESGEYPWLNVKLVNSFIKQGGNIEALIKMHL